MYIRGTYGCPFLHVAADFRTRADAIEAMKQVITEVTAPSLVEEGCQIYHWFQGAEDPTHFVLYMEWRDKSCFEAHIATPHVKHAEDRLKRKKCSSSQRKNRTSIESSTAHRAVATKNSRVNFTAYRPLRLCDTRAAHVILSLRRGERKRQNLAA